MKIRFVICAATLTLVAAACGSDDATTVVEPTGTEAAEATTPDAAAEATDTAAQDASPTSSAAAPEPSPTTEGSTPEAGEVGTGDDGTGTDGTGYAAAPAGPGDVPDLQMVNMHSGATIDLQSVVDGQTPLLFWFWAPH